MLAPRMSLFCGSMLVMLGLVSFTMGPLLDLDFSSSSRHCEPAAESAPPRSDAGAAWKSVGEVVSNVSVAGGTLPVNIWVSPLAKFFRGCSAPSKSFPRRISELESNGYIFVETSGGLNQQRIGITDAVVVARVLNATLVVPFLDHGSFWKDSSNFSDIFDADWFIAALAPDVVIVKEVPAKLNIARELFYSTRAPRKSEPEYYVQNVLPLLKRKKAIRLTKFDYRLSSNLEEDLQKLRCRVNYHALQFTAAIANMGNLLVKRLKQRSGRYIALHLRFEPDMLAFTGCYYGGGKKERKELGELRKRWNTLSPMKSEGVRRSGKCPLTPEEVGLMLQALGFEADSHIYVASGEIYGGEDTLAPLRRLFPNLHSKDSLGSYKELKPFGSYSSRMAAIDYIVCEHSDVFITNYNGNMARILAGSRRYFGHRRTIQPNVKKLGSLFLSWPNMTWDAFSFKLRTAQRGFVGEPNEIRPGGEFFEFPNSCICHSQEDRLSIEDSRQEVQSSLNIADELGIDDGSEAENSLMQQADLESEANALGQSEEKEPVEIPWLSD